MRLRRAHDGGYRAGVVVAGDEDAGFHRKSTKVWRLRALGGICNASISSREAARNVGEIFVRACIASRNVATDAGP